MKYIATIIISLIFLCKPVFSQNTGPNSRTIKWQKKIYINKEAAFTDEILLSTKVEYYLSFEGATYTGNEKLLPQYHELIKLTGSYGKNTKAVIENTKFIPFTDSEIKDVKHLDNINRTISVTSEVYNQRKQPYLSVSFIPIRLNSATNRLEKIISFDIRLIRGSSNIKKTRTQKREYARESVLNKGKWAKIKIENDGIHALTFEKIISLGFDDPKQIRIFGNGGGMLPLMNSEPRLDDLVENNILIKDNYILFYAKGSTNWTYDKNDKIFRHETNCFTDTAYYFITDYNTGKNNQIPTTASVNKTPEINITTFDDYQLQEMDSVNLAKSGKKWFWKTFDNVTQFSFDFSFPNIVAGTQNIATEVAAKSPINTSFKIKAAKTTKYLSVFWTVSALARLSAANLSFNSDTDDFIISYEYLKNGSPSAKGWLNYISVNTKRQLKMSGKQMIFRSTETLLEGKITKFTLSEADANTIVWDITDPVSVNQMQTSRNGNQLEFTIENNTTIRQYVAFDAMAQANDFYNPVVTGYGVGEIENQNLHGLAPADMIIVVYPDTGFVAQANILADIHRENDNLNVHVVTTDKIYNEFSSGAPDVSAIRDFMKMFYDRAMLDSELPQYLLLFGDGSYDTKNIYPDLFKNSPSSNYIPTFQTEESLSETASFTSDDFFGMLDNDEGKYTGLLDIGIGRLPVQNRKEAYEVVEKIKRYISNTAMADWRNIICFIADDQDSNAHSKQANDLATFIETTYPAFNTEKIFFDAFPQISMAGGQRYPEVTKAINSRMKRGALIVNYTGHANPERLAHENVINKQDILRWDNNDFMPIFITASCEYSRFDYYNTESKTPEQSAGELILLNPKGGGIALLSTTRPVYGSSNFTLNMNFYKSIFEKNANGKSQRLGDVVRIAKNETNSPSSENKRSFCLLGDPALTLAYPGNDYDIVTSSLNGKSFIEKTDTLKAFSKATIAGYIQDKTGNKITNFNGTIYPTVYDKETTQKTLGNDGDSIMNFSVQNNRLYRGKASVTNGNFSFSFIVPKDISYTIGNGKISYYAIGNFSNNSLKNNSTDNIDLHDYNDKIIIGGSTNNVQSDTQGPEIELYLNDENFVPGSMTDENPIIIAYVTDENGINTVGNGIGHDITATIDEDANQIVILNDVYEADKDSYKSGKIEYSLADLTEGEHELKLKVWDVYNNSGEAITDFVVANAEDLSLERVFNYPNPFTSQTSFYFHHNNPNDDLDVLIQIFTVSGKIVKTIESVTNTSSYLSEPIPWDGLDDYGDKIGRGVYIYRLKVRNTNGQIADKFEKLLILK